MRYLLFTVVVSLVLVSCKQDNRDQIIDKDMDNPEQDVSQSIAQRSGIDGWQDVNQVNFTFNVARNGEKISSRKWQWNPQNDDVQLTAQDETVTYNRKDELDSLAISTDRAFINDVYWLLPQFKLVWDKGTKITYPETDQDMLVQLEYVGDGGYTPGDRYDMTIDSDRMISRWQYFPAGSQEPAMETSFEDYKDYNGIAIATNHRTPDGSLNIYFTDIQITKE
jgi:hypothetical protein